MTSYSDIIQVIGSMIIFSMILLNANSMILRNSMLQVEGELEQEVVALGQEIIEEALNKSFDEVVAAEDALPPTAIPGGFTPPENLGPDSGEESREDFNDFDDYNGWEGTVTTAHGAFHLSVEVFYVNEISDGDAVRFQSSTGQSTFKKIEVTLTNDLLNRNDGEPVEYTLEFVRNYYAD